MPTAFKHSSLKGALALIDELATDRQQDKRVVEAREAIQQMLALIESRARIRCIPELAHHAGLSPETVRRKLLKRFPEAKVGGRYRLSDEIIAAFIAELS